MTARQMVNSQNKEGSCKLERNCEFLCHRSHILLLLGVLPIATHWIFFPAIVVCLVQKLLLRFAKFSQTSTLIFHLSYLISLMFYQSSL